jgi:hypothetical protein
MVKIENVEELRKINQSDYGFVIIIEDNNPTIHSTNCKVISENDFLQEINNSSNYHWFSTYSLAQKELGDLNSCKFCNPDTP